MDKSVGADKRRQDKRHKKPHPAKPGIKSQKEAKDTAAATSSAPLIVYDDRYSKRPIESNWNSHRNFSSDQSESDDEQLNAANFEKLLQMPASSSGHFFLSTEKHWNTTEPSIAGEKSNQQYGEYFKIDTKLLNACLATIPFYERQGYSEDLFSKEEINSMKLKATFASDKYKILCSKLDTNKKMAENRVRDPPVKCLIGAGALPVQPREEVIIEPIRQPVPCLIGPMALPPSLRNDPNVTGSYTSVSPAVASVSDRLNEVRIDNQSSREDDVPIGSNIQPGVSADMESSGKEKEDKSNNGKKGDNESKEDIQQWLDDILDM